jgi:hypothetical protein
MFYTSYKSLKKSRETGAYRVIYFQKFFKNAQPWQYQNSDNFNFKKILRGRIIDLIKGRNKK